MKFDWATMLTIAAGAAALFAEFNLWRVFLGLLREDRLEHQRARRPARPAQTQRDICTPDSAGIHVGRFWTLGLSCWAAAAIPLAAHAQGASDGANADRTSYPQPPAPPPEPLTPLTISTERPTLNDGTGIVPIGHFQLETGYTFTFRRRDGVETQTHNGPELLGRVALIQDRLELRVNTSGYVWSRTNSGSGFDSSEGFSDAMPGVKLKVLDENGWVPRLALEATTTVGLGGRSASNRDVEPTFKLLWSYDLGKGWGIYGDANVAYLTTGGERFVQGQGGFCVTWAATDKLSFFGEYFVQGPNTKGSDAAHYTDFGGAYLLTNRIQLDARVGFGLNHEANNIFSGLGVSLLF